MARSRKKGRGNRRRRSRHRRHKAPVCRAPIAPETVQEAEFEIPIEWYPPECTVALPEETELAEQPKSSQQYDCQIETRDGHPCHKAGVVLNIQLVLPYLGRAVNDFVLRQIHTRTALRHRSAQCCHLCWFHFGQILSQALLNSPAFARFLVYTFMSINGVSPDFIRNLKQDVQLRSSIR